MKKQKNSVFKYWRQYKWSNIFAMMRNNRGNPSICSEDFTGDLLVITGATSGIGYYTTRKYASHGARVLSINRNREKSERLCEELQQDFGVECSYLIADMSRMDDVKRVGKELSDMNETIDVLIHNAGVYLTRKSLTEDGFETTYAVNYLSSFILNYLLKEKLKTQDRSRIIMVNSEGHRFAVWGIKPDDMNWQKRRYSGLRAYGSAKTAQLLSMLIFNDFFKGSIVTINAMHPGAVKTATGKENSRLYRRFKNLIIDKMSRSPDISAEALYYLGVSKEVESTSGKFFNLTTEEKPAPPALDREIAERLWSVSLRDGGFDDGKL
ncbi:MAG TPA: short-chain dehydrogenase [Kosmotogaceae bacterium]|nr:short-chain dehydrogenase [Kosmotogaceae bacterium]